MICLEETWRDGFDFGMGRVCSEYLIHQSLLLTTVVSLRNTAWVYKTSDNKAHELISVNFNLISGSRMYNVQTLTFRHDAADLMMNFLFENCPDIALGFDGQLDDLCYNQDMDGLRNYAHTQRRDGFMHYVWNV